MRQYAGLRGSQLDRQTAVVGAGAFFVAASVLAAYAYRRHRTRAPYGLLEWQDAIQHAGSICNFSSIARAVAKQGLDPSIRAELWPFLLDVFSADSSCEQRQQQHLVMVEQYQSLLLQCQAYEVAMQEHLQAVKLASHGSPGGRTSPQHQQQPQQQPQQQQPQQQQPPAVSQPQQAVVQFSEAHRIIVIDAVRTDFRKHSIAGVMGLTGQAPGFHNSSYGHLTSSSSGSSALNNLTGAVSSAAPSWLHGWLGLPDPGGDHTPPAPMWVSLVTQQVLDASHHLTQDLKRQVVRMVAILSAYAVYDPATGYCQGMSDLLLPLLVLFEDDALAFWCFASVMQTVGLRRNFAVDESGIFSQLSSLGAVLGIADATVAHKLRTIGAAECHFAYRMVVVLMRRDLPLQQVVALWDALWADSWCCRHLWQHPADQQHTGNDAAAAVAEGAGASGLGSPPTSPTAAAAAAAGAGLSGHSHTQEGVPAVRAASSSGAMAGQGREPTLFTCFVAAVVLSQKRRILEDCRDADDLMRLFHSLRFIDFPACLHKAHQLRAMCSSKLK